MEAGGGGLHGGMQGWRLKEVGLEGARPEEVGETEPEMLASWEWGTGRPQRGEGHAGWQAWRLVGTELWGCIRQTMGLEAHVWGARGPGR